MLLLAQAAYSSVERRTTERREKREKYDKDAKEIRQQPS